MDVTTSMLGLAFAIFASLQLLSSISTCRPIANYHQYNTNAHINNHSSSTEHDDTILNEVNNHTATTGNIMNDGSSTPINNHSSDSARTIRLDDDDHLTNQHTPSTPLVPALFAFGDSTVDAGNNNHLTTISRSNFAPYGRDLPDKRPTGRFCNGMLVTDYIASKLGLEPRMIAYLDIQNNAKTRLGLLNMPLHLEVSFGSASSGFYDSTAAHFNALPLRKQVAYFREYRQRLFQDIGEEDAMEVLAKAIFIISTGTNDYLNNYFVNPYLRSKYTLSQFQSLLLGLCAQLIKDIYGLGARRVGVVSLPPIGCLPAIRTLYRKGEVQGCVDHLNNYAMHFNQELERTLLPLLQDNLTGIHLAYMDSNSVVLDIVKNPAKYGIKQAQKACCGSGKVEVGIFCNKFSFGTCKDARKYAFWDSFHPTDHTNQILATKLLEQVWKVFNMDDRYVYYYKHPPTKVHHNGEDVTIFLHMEQWRCRIFLLGCILYFIHLIKQFFPKIIDLGI